MARSSREEPITRKSARTRAKRAGGVTKAKDKIGLSLRRRAAVARLNTDASSDNYRMPVHARSRQITKAVRPFGSSIDNIMLRHAQEMQLNAAAQDMIRWMNEQDNYVAGDQVKQALAGLKSEYNLKRASITFQEGKWGISLQINPRLFIPMTTTVISGAKASPATPIPSGDYLRATRHDGPFDTPIQEIIKDWNTHYGTKIQKINIHDINLSSSEISGYTNTSQRPGSVEAVSSVPRGTGRSGSGETAIGHLGGQQQLIMTGAHDADFNGGHLIGDQLLNSHNNFNLYETWNLAPQHRQFNSPTYSSVVEGPATSAIDAGNTVKIDVDVHYDRDVEKVSTSAVMNNILTPGANKTKILNDLANTHIPGSAGLPTTLSFHTRIPRFWSASAEIKTGTGTMSGSVSQRATGTLTNNALSEADDASFGAGKTYIYSISKTAGGQSAYLDPSNFDSKGKQSYQNATKIKQHAQQETYTTQPPQVATSSSTSTLTTITAHNANSWGAGIPSNRVSAIVAWLPGNAAKIGTGLTTLVGAHGGIPGIGPATIKRIKNNGFTL